MQHDAQFFTLLTCVNWRGRLRVDVWGLCVCMSSLLGIEVWSQNIDNSTVSIPWLVMPTLLKFQKSQKNNEA